MNTRQGALSICLPPPSAEVCHQRMCPSLVDPSGSAYWTSTSAFALAGLSRINTYLTEEIFQRAIAAQGALARRGQHRLPIPDLIIAAAAESEGLTVLHYDADFDRIAAVTGQEVEWVVHKGSV